MLYGTSRHTSAARARCATLRSIPTSGSCSFTTRTTNWVGKLRYLFSPSSFLANYGPLFASTTYVSCFSLPYVSSLWTLSRPRWSLSCSELLIATTIHTITIPNHQYRKKVNNAAYNFYQIPRRAGIGPVTVEVRAKCGVKANTGQLAADHPSTADPPARPCRSYASTRSWYVSNIVSMFLEHP